MSARRRIRWVLAAVAVATAVAAAGIVAGRHITSSRAAAAHAKPPPPGDVIAYLAKRTLASDITAVAHRRLTGGYAVTAGAVASPDAVVTRVDVRLGDRLREGDLIADVSGQPVLALVLPFPLYRDLAMGDRGPDVTAVVAALERMGYVGHAAAQIDTSVRGAIDRLLADYGYAHLVPTAGRASLVLRRSWIARLDRSDRLVSQVNIRVGSTLSDSAAAIVRCDVAPPGITALLDHAAGSRVRVGDQAVVNDNASGSTLVGHVVKVGTPTGAGVPVDIGADDRTALAALSGDLVVTVTARVGRDAVLAAPVSAIYTDVDGTSHLLVPGASSGDDRPVAVTLGPCAAGWCQIVKSAPALHAGDRVVVGAAGARTNE